MQISSRFVALALVLSLGLAGCTVHVPPGTTNPRNFTVATLQQAAGVNVRGAATTSDVFIAKVEAVACQRFAWEPLATNDAALTLLKEQAAQRGANALVNVSYRHANVHLAENCYDNIVASGDAYHSK